MPEEDENFTERVGTLQVGLKTGTYHPLKNQRQELNSCKQENSTVKIGKVEDLADRRKWNWKSLLYNSINISSC